MGDIERGAPLEFSHQVFCSQAQFDPGVSKRTNVFQVHVESGRVGNRRIEQQILRISDVIIYRGRNPVDEHSYIKPRVPLGSGFPFQIRIGEGDRYYSRVRSVYGSIEKSSGS